MFSESGVADQDDKDENAKSAQSEGGKKGGAPDRNDRKDQDKDTDKQDGGKDAPKKPLNPLIKVLLILLAIAVVVAIIAYAIYWWTRGSYYQSTNDAYLQADQVDISPRISGFVDQVLVGDNQNVRAGQVLVRISSRDYTARTDSDRAQVAEAQASILEADAQIRQQEAQIAQSEAQLAQSRAQERQYAASAQFDRSQASRYRPLARAGAETDEKSAQYASQARQSDAQLQSARAQAAADGAKVEYARRQIDVYRAQRLSADAKVAEAQAKLASDQVDLNGAELVSPTDGRVGDRTVRFGEYLQAGTRVMTIVPVQAIWLKANFKETQIGLMRVGQPASITVDALSGVTLHGEVESFSPGTGAQFSLTPTDNATGNFTKITQRVPVRIRVDAGEQAREVLVPGLSVKATVDTFGAKDELQAYKEETRNTRKEQREESKRENQQDRQDHSSGAGHE